MSCLINFQSQIDTIKLHDTHHLVNRTIFAGAPKLSAELVQLIAQYLLPEPDPKVWTAEWTGAHGYDVLRDAITKAAAPELLLKQVDNRMLPHRLVDLILQYLRKNDIFGQAAEMSLPLEIDDELQALLSQYFRPEDLQAFPNIRQITQLYSAHFCPAGMTANSAARMFGQKFTEYSWKQALQEHGDAATPADCVVLFPKDVFWRGEPVIQQEALMPQGSEFPCFPIAVFCIFNTFHNTQIYIMSENPWTGTRCQEETQGYKLLVGGFGARGLPVILSYYDCVPHGVAPVRMFRW